MSETTVIGPATRKLLAEVNAFLKRSGMAESTLGKNALQNSRAIVRLRQGGAVSIERAEALRTYMRNWKAMRPFRPRRRRAAG